MQWLFFYVKKMLKMFFMLKMNMANVKKNRKPYFYYNAHN